MIEDLVAGARFLFRLPSFLRHPVSLAEARAILRHRLERREEDFLALARRMIYDYPPSPYRQLLTRAGCEYGDLETLVRLDGVEGALHSLLRHGVYLTVEEFKGRRPVVRGALTIDVNPSLFANPFCVAHLPRQSGGSRGSAVSAPIDLAFVRDRSVNTLLALEARNGAGWRHASWGVPGSAAMVFLLEVSGFGASPARWFSQVDPASPGLHARYRWSIRALRLGGLLAGVAFPRPEHVSLENCLPIARWMAEVLEAGSTPHLYTFASSAARLCQVALDAGINLRGAQFMVAGEPVTRARLEMISRAGAEAAPRYASSESGRIGYGCLAPAAPDEVHLFHDFHALIQPGEGATDLRPEALLISSLRPTAPFVLLNASLGDQAVMGRRRCGCPMEGFGWTTHLHTIRSFEKLTAGGMTFLDADVIRVLEEVLPARFGGRPIDYQLVEGEAEDGRPCLRLLVHPAIGRLNSDEVTEAFLKAISPGSGAERIMALAWREGSFLRVERRPPLVTASGKILHLHVNHGAG